MLDGLNTLNEFNDKDSTPTNMEFVHFMFWEKGIGYTEFCELPIPYIISIIKTHNYVKKKEEEANKKASRKK